MKKIDIVIDYDPKNSAQSKINNQIKDLKKLATLYNEILQKSMVFIDSIQKLNQQLNNSTKAIEDLHKSYSKLIKK